MTKLTEAVDSLGAHIAQQRADYAAANQCAIACADSHAQGLILGSARPARAPDCLGQGVGTNLARPDALRAAIGAMEASLAPLPALPPGEAFTRATCERLIAAGVAHALNRDRARVRADGWVLREEAQEEIVRILREVLAQQNAPADAAEQILWAACLRLSDWARRVDTPSQG